MNPAVRRALFGGANNKTAINLNFANGIYSKGSQRFGVPSDIPGWSFTRASTKTALSSSGAVVSFGSGVPAITDLGLLIEQSVTNSFLQSQTFDNGTWVKTNATITADAVAAPDGTTTADKLIASAGSAQHYVSQAVSGLTALEARTVSVYAKYAGVQYLGMYMSQGPVQAWFDLQAGTVSNITGAATITALGNGWYRCSITSASAAGTSDTYELHTATTSGSMTMTGDGVNGVYLWGAQLERAAAFPTSYIPTTSSAVTRAADVASIGSLSLTSPITMLAAVQLTGAGGIEQDLLSLGVDVNNVLNLNRDTSSHLNALVRNASVSQYNVATSTTFISVPLKAAMTYDGSTYRSAANGSSLTASAAGKTVPSLTTLRIGDWIAGGGPVNGYVQRIVIYQSALSDAQLQALTQ